MPIHNEAYVLTEHIFDTLSGANAVLGRNTLQFSDVKYRPVTSESATPARLEMAGIVDEAPVIQTLSRVENGYLFSEQVTDRDYPPAEVLIGPDASLEEINTPLNSLFMRRLIQMSHWDASEF